MHNNSSLKNYLLKKFNCEKYKFFNNMMVEIKIFHISF